MGARAAALRLLLATVALVCLAALAFRGAYLLEEPLLWNDQDTGLQVRILRTAERWRPVTRSHPLDVAPGDRLLSLEPLGGLAHLTVHRLGCGTVTNPDQVIAAVDAARRPLTGAYKTFWRAPARAAWRLERSFQGRKGLKTIKNLTYRGGAYLAFDYVVAGEDGCWWYVGAFVRRALFPYYEVELKYHLSAVTLP